LLPASRALLEDLARTLTPAQDIDLKDFAATRRGLLLAPLLAALPAALIADPAHAIDPNETQVTLPDQYQWKPGLPGAPAQSVETVPVFGATDKPGLYVVLIKWHPGFMSAPHTYVTDRLCFVISGTWWVNSGENFEPENTVPVPAGGFVRRVAHTPHYDGVRKGGKEPAVIGIFGQGPIEFKLVDPTTRGQCLREAAHQRQIGGFGEAVVNHLGRNLYSDEMKMMRPNPLSRMRGP
jgi:hypothetical protein